MTNWTYNNVQIDVSEHGYFTATVDDRKNEKPTLAEIKEWIDKEIAANVKKITINLPVCVVVSRREDYFSARMQAIRTVITGVHRQTGKAQCKDIPDGFDVQKLLPDSDQNFALCQEYIAASKVTNSLARAINALHIDGPGGRIDAPNYQTVLDTLTRKHGEKTAECAKVHEALAAWKAKETK